MPIPGGSSGCACAACPSRWRAAMTEAPLTVLFRTAGALDPVQRFAGWASELSGWRRQLAALVLGALAALALPPFDLVPLLALSFSGLIWLADGIARPRQGFALGWSFGFGFFLVGLY